MCYQLSSLTRYLPEDAVASSRVPGTVIIRQAVRREYYSFMDMSKTLEVDAGTVLTLKPRPEPVVRELLAA